MSDLERLLELQANDLDTDRARHRRATLPERSIIAELDAAEAAARAAVSGPADERAALGREQRRLEDEIATLEQKIVQVNHQLYEEGLTSPKEAQALQADLESLQRHQRTLEDEVLELMERIEPLDDVLAETEAQIVTIGLDRTAARNTLVAAEAVIDAEIDALLAARGALVEPIPVPLLEEYERLRRGSDGIGIARLHGATCTGCHLALAPAEVDAIRRAPAGEYSHCPDCGRLLVP